MSILPSLSAGVAGERGRALSDFIYWETERIYAKYKTRDPFQLLDAMGARVIFTNEYGRRGLKGYSTIMNRVKFAVINARLPRAEQKVVAGHEAGHLIIHTDEILSSPVKALRDFNMFDNSGRIEYQANLFLADFMLDDDEVMEYIDDEYMDFFSTARSLYVPPHLFAFKLYSMMRRGYEVRSPIDLDSKFLGK